jgi:hypothetical protein
MTGRNLKWSNTASVASAFVAGVVTGVFMREALQRTQELARRKLAHREREDTVTYDENLPEVLERREPAPHSGQPRYGGTGAIGVSPSAVATPRRTT